MVAKLKGCIWFRIKAGYEDDVSMWNLAPLAELLWVRSVSWSKNNDTDGHIPTKALGRVGVRIGAPAELQALADQLVDEGRWVPTEGGWDVSKYEKWQETIADRAEETENKRQAGFAKAHKEGKHATPHPECDVCSAGAVQVQCSDGADAVQAPCTKVLETETETETELETELETDKTSSSSTVTYTGATSEPEPIAAESPEPPKELPPHLVMTDQVLAKLGMAKPKATIDEVKAVKTALKHGWTWRHLEPKVDEFAAKATHNKRRYVFTSIGNLLQPPEAEHMTTCPECLGETWDDSQQPIECKRCDNKRRIPTRTLP